MKIMIVLWRTSSTQYTFWVTIVRGKKALTWEKFYGVVVFWNQPQLCRDGTQRWIRFAAFIIHMQLQQNEHEILPWKWSINFKHSWRRKGWPGGAGRAITLNDSALLLMRQESKKTMLENWDVFYRISSFTKRASTWLESQKSLITIE